MTDARRADLERQLTLVQGWRRDEATWEYDLVDASPAGIQRLIHTPEIEDTHNIDRGRARVAPDAPFGTTPLADRRLEGWIHSSLFDWFTLLWVSSLFVSGVWLASSDHAGTS